MRRPPSGGRASVGQVDADGQEVGAEGADHTFAAAHTERNRQALIAAVIAAQDDPNLEQALREFLARRRTALTEVIGQSRSRGEIHGAAQIELAVEQAFGVLWYRILFQPNALHAEGAAELAAALTAQLAAV